LADLATSYDMANVGSEDAAQCIINTWHDPRYRPVRYQWDASPIVILVHNQYMPLLRTLGLVRQAGGIQIFDLHRYMTLVRKGQRWIAIRGNTSYRVEGRVLVAITDPLKSNSGAMFVASAYAALTNDDDPNPTSQGDPGLPIVREAFTDVSGEKSQSLDLMSDFLQEGSVYPMVAVNEADYLYHLGSSSAMRGRPAGVTALYPSVDVVSYDTLVAWTPVGQRMAGILLNGSLTTIEEAHGYRTGNPYEVGNSAAFVAFWKGKGVTVPNLGAGQSDVDFIPEPDLTGLCVLISAVTSDKQPYPGCPSR
jgi:hypothetical protein